MSKFNEFFAIALLIVLGFSVMVFYLRHRMMSLGNKLNGRLTELLKVTKELARVQGIEEGKLEERRTHHDN